MTNQNEAITFLMEYGWALLTVIIAIGILIYYDIYQPSKQINIDCLTKIATHYCLENNQTFSSIPDIQFDNSFLCSSQQNDSYIRHFGKEKVTTTYYFLQSEISNCTQ